jgi:hypothetical protein
MAEIREEDEYSSDDDESFPNHVQKRGSTDRSSEEVSHTDSDKSSEDSEDALVIQKPTKQDRYRMWFPKSRDAYD